MSALPNETAGTSTTDKPTNGHYGKWLLIVVGLGIVIRLILAPLPGYRIDTATYQRWTMRVAEKGVFEFYAGVPPDYPPLFAYLNWPIGKIAQHFNLKMGSPMFNALIKAPALLLEIIVALAVFSHLKKKNPAAAKTACAMILFNPVILYGSAFWGQTDTLIASLVFLSILRCLNGGYMTSGILASLAILLKPHAVVALPFIAVETWRKGSVRAPATFAFGFLLSLGLTIPFLVKVERRTPFLTSFSAAVGRYTSRSLYAANVWQLGTPDSPDYQVIPIFHGLVPWGDDGTYDTKQSAVGHFTYRTVSILAFVIIVACIFPATRRFSPDMRVWLNVSAAVLMFFMFCTEMHERYIIPLLITLAVPAAMEKRWRIIYYVATVSFLLELAVVLPPDDLMYSLSIINIGIVGAVIVLLMRSAMEQRSMPPKTAYALQSVAFVTIIIVIIMSIYPNYSAALRQVNARNRDEGKLEDTLYLSDLGYRSYQQAWRTPLADRSVFGDMLSHNGVLYHKGLGAHAAGRIDFDVPEGYDRFRCLIGLDGEVKPGDGSVVFRVLLDEKEIYRSPLLTSGDPLIHIDLDVAGKKTLSLIQDDCREVDNNANKSDHGDWFLARLIEGKR